MDVCANTTTDSSIHPKLVKVDSTCTDMNRDDLDPDDGDHDEWNMHRIKPNKYRRRDGTKHHNKKRSFCGSTLRAISFLLLAVYALLFTLVLFRDRKEAVVTKDDCNIDTDVLVMSSMPPMSPRMDTSFALARFREE